jgi:hypothetical protein
VADDPERTWFAGKPGAFVVFRVNRRPIDPPEGTMFWREPGEVFGHFTRVLAPGYPVRTKGKAARTWRVGGVEVDDAEGLLTGQIGFESQGHKPADEWSEADKAYHPGEGGRKDGRALPFGFDRQTRFLTVLRDPGIKPQTVAGVFQKLLQANEDELDPEERTTEWAVEPVLDGREFRDWLASVEVVKSVKFRAKLPNPEPKDAFADVVRRIELRKGTELTEEMKSSKPAGLIGIEHDQEFQQAVTMGEYGFAELSGVGYRDGEKTTFKQADRMAAERVAELPDDWHAVRVAVRSLLRGALLRFVPEGDPRDDG